jgi:Bax protein
MEMAKPNMTNRNAEARKFFAALSSRARRLADPRIGVSAALVGAVALAVAFSPAPVPETGLWYDTEGKLIAASKAGTHQVARTDLAKPRGVTVVPGSAGKLYADFRVIGYRLEDVRAGSETVPRVFVKAIPRDIRQMNSVDRRKAVFIKTMLPLILRVNEELRHVRSRIRDLADRLNEGGVLTEAERNWLDTQFALHAVSSGKIDVLLRRVDVIPPSLALAQAAEESGWGTSRFALDGHALFGQRAHPEGRGIVPAAHAEDGGIKVKAFDALMDGVRSYARNLNTHNAYRDFRKLRASMRGKARGPLGFNSMRLAETLERYSERGAAYVETIQSIIRVNNLRQFDGARLSDNRAPDWVGNGA